MATITRGRADNLVDSVKAALDEYERTRPGSSTALYRQNSASIRVRVVDPGFGRAGKSDRHDLVWRFLEDRLTDDAMQEISVLLLLTPSEVGSSFLNADFDDPIPSAL